MRSQDDQLRPASAPGPCCASARDAAPPTLTRPARARIRTAAPYRARAASNERRWDLRTPAGNVSLAPVSPATVSALQFARPRTAPRGNALATLASLDGSDAPARAHSMDDSDASGPLLRACKRVEGLVGRFPRSRSSPLGRIFLAGRTALTAR